MRCSVCGQEAVIRLRHAGLRLCPQHLVARVEKEVEGAIRRFRMFSPETRVLVAVSGGKDSLALWHILAKSGYRADGLFIDLGIEGYSGRSQDVAQAFAEERGLTLHVVSLAEELGATLDELTRIARGKPCSLCGTVKRYLMNRLAWEGGYSALATGHNLDDEAATLLGNVLRWEEDYLSRQYPVLPGEGKLVRKAKPLVFLSEREMAAYCLITGIRYLKEDCPHAQGARSIVLKGILNQLEDRYPATKISFLRQFLRVRDRFRPPEPARLGECQSCGMPTAAEGTCRFCRLKEAVTRHTSRHGTPA
ncbi:MAG: hypothetical protein XD60_0015 [Acetothermia bacterium 64_32]|nr:MAG: hypothetical protein XD60_0015 [Acetothermia bacterium 64_32]HAF70085.1 tRNA(Ile)-lysidine synthetase [Candidatus Acetothermia bacterium]